MKKRAVLQRGLLKAINMDSSELGQLGLHRCVISGARVGRGRGGGGGGTGGAGKRGVWKEAGENGKVKERTLVTATQTLQVTANKLCMLISHALSAVSLTIKLSFVCKGDNHSRGLPRLVFKLVQPTDEVGHVQVVC